MTDIAVLGIAADSSQVTKASTELKKFAGAAKQADVANDGLAMSAHAAAKAEQAQTLAIKANTTATMANAKATNMAAFQRRNLVFQLNDVFQSMALGMPIQQTLLQQGPQIAQIYGPGEGGIGRAFKETGKMITEFVGKYKTVGIILAAGAVAFAGLNYEIGKTTDKSITLGNTIKSTGQVIWNSITSYIKPATDQIGAWFSRAWDIVVDVTKATMNFLVREVIAAVEIIKTVVMAIPPAFIVAGEKAANGFLKSIIWMLREVSVKINETIGSMNQMFSDAGVDFKIGQITPPGYGEGVDLGGNAAMAEINALFDTLEKRRAEIANTDYMGDFFNAVRDQAIANIPPAEEELKKMGAAAKAANDNIWQMSEALGALGPATIDPFTLLQQQMADLNRLLDQGVISWQQYGEAAYRANMAAASSTLNLASGLTGALSQMFKDNKAFAIANAVVNTAEAVTKTLAQYGATPWGFAAAGVAAASGAAQIAAIVASDRGSSTVASAGGSQAAIPPPSGSDAPQRTTNVTLVGNGFSGEQIVELLNEALGDGHKINVNTAA